MQQELKILKNGSNVYVAYENTGTPQECSMKGNLGHCWLTCNGYHCLLNCKTEHYKTISNSWIGTPIDRIYEIRQGKYDTTVKLKEIYNIIKNIKDFNGVSKCSPEDEFDSDIGNLFARNRLLSKYTKYKMIIARKISEEIIKDYEICRRISIAGYDPTIHDALASLGLSVKEYE